MLRETRHGCVPSAFYDGGKESSIALGAQRGRHGSLDMSSLYLAPETWLRLLAYVRPQLGHPFLRAARSKKEIFSSIFQSKRNVSKGVEFERSPIVWPKKDNPRRGMAVR